MQINFTGTKNIGYKCDYRYPVTEQDGKMVYNQNEYIDVNTINMQLMDDYNGQDLSNYKKLISTDVANGYRHPVYPNFLNIGIIKGELPSDRDTYFFLNGKRLEVNDENLGIFSFLAKTLKGLTQKPLEKFVVNHDYLFGEDAGKLMVLGADLEDDYEDHFEYLQEIGDLHRNEHVQNGAKKMLELLENKIYEYLDI